ncbi:class I SAM-dependent methyltransferase [Jannaschia sp. S6380]|uniref:class I SAM-dependent methyltransferase n=1 Tax=Jannaschia sp. S6380 TaxID=2926408 RepID=UPI001FF37087|nr:class I SAM-dependent methyltransferase [Jannaschia sp. S6380]MCK0167234.1 class I SAM-dependent methyltransferase [Jannaschia sp. S6380]
MPGPTSPDPAITFWDRIADKYARRPVDDPAAYEAKLADVADRLESTDRVLELGCGTGSTALRLAPRVAHVTAVDGSGTMIAIARSKLGGDAPVNVSFREADIMETIPGQPFDVICAFSLLHLVPDLPGALSRIHDQLRPGGLFLSKTPCLADRTVLLRLAVGAMRLVGKAPPVTFLKAEALRGHLRQAGFVIESTSYFGKGRLSPYIVAHRPED